MEFMEKCCFVFSLKKGAVLLDVFASGICIINTVYSIIKTIHDSSLIANELVHILIFLTVNTIICCLVQFITYYSVKGYMYKWYIGFSFFVFVLCQIIAVVIVLTEFIQNTSSIGIAVTTILLTAVLFYFILVVISIFYHNAEVVRIEKEAGLRQSSIHLVSEGQFKKRYLIPLNSSNESLEEEIS